MSEDRHEPFRRLAREAGLDAVALVPGANFERLYRHAFHENERPLVVVIPVEGRAAAVVPNLELASFAALRFDGEVFDWRDQTGYRGAFEALARALPIGSLGVEGQRMRFFVAEALREGARADGRELRLVDAEREIASLRLCKSAAEIAALRAAIATTEAALADTVDALSVGMTEKAIEHLLVQRLFARGADALSFAPIVAAGANSARPHASARADYAVAAGDALLFDLGARKDGLCADITRTFYVGHLGDEQAAVHETVLAANRAGREASAPGATAHAVDEAATAVLEASPFRDRIRHKTGHGLGREVHEAPWIMRGNAERLRAGMVYTVEPGLYEPERFGVRIEDDVLITADGAESLTTFERAARVIG